MSRYSVAEVSTRLLRKAIIVATSH